MGVACSNSTVGTPDSCVALVLPGFGLSRFRFIGVALARALLGSLHLLTLLGFCGGVSAAYCPLVGSFRG